MGSLFVRNSITSSDGHHRHSQQCWHSAGNLCSRPSTGCAAMHSPEQEPSAASVASEVSGSHWHLPQTPSLDRSWSQTLRDLEASDKRQLHESRANVKGWALLGLAYSATGVIFGDIATSPLYVFPSVFYQPPSREDSMGALCLIFWTLSSIGLLKYVSIVLYANDAGEGGTISLYSLLCRELRVGFSYRTHASDAHTLSKASMQRPSLARGSLRRSSASEADRPGHQDSWLRGLLEGSQRAKRVLFVFVLLGTCMVVGDGIITPAISVLSAVEGLRVAVPQLPQETVVAITVAILLVLFSLQRYGTGLVGPAFAPILLVWLFSIAVIGLVNAVAMHPRVFAAVWPGYGVQFFLRNGWGGWQMLGGVLLCITGTEAMFADLGHFNLQAIQISFSCVAYPCVLLQYFGQTAYIIAHPQDYQSAFWSSVPRPVFWPLLVIGTLAAIVASQALITGVFSIVHQLLALNCIPRVKVVHTSTHHYGQIFIPEVNWLLATLTVLVVMGFQTSVDLGNAYGVAVTVDMIVTTHLVTLVMLLIWEVPLWAAAAFYACFTAIEGAYFSATLLKVPTGGWFPIAVAFAFSSMMYVWHWTSRLKRRRAVGLHVALEHFFAPAEDQLRLLWSPKPLARLPGIGFYFSDAKGGVPPVLQHFLTNIQALHDVVVLVHVRHVPVSSVLPEERLLIQPLTGFAGMYRAVARYGYKDRVLLGAPFQAQLVGALYRVFNWEEDSRHGRPKSAQPTADNSRAASVAGPSGSREGSAHGGPPAHAGCEQPDARQPGSSLIRASLERVVQGQQMDSRRAERSTSLTEPLLAVSVAGHGNDGDDSHYRSGSRDSGVPGTSGQPETPQLPPDVGLVFSAQAQGAVYIVGRSTVVARAGSPWLRRFLLEGVYKFLNDNCRGWALAQDIPLLQLIEIGIVYEV